MQPQMRYAQNRFKRKMWSLMGVNLLKNLVELVGIEPTTSSLRTMGFK